MHTTKCCQQDQGKYKKSPQTKRLFIYLLFHKIKFLLITVIKIFKKELSKELKEAINKARNLEENVKKDIQIKSNADEIRKYKELLDDGIITQEEFEIKKQQLLK